MRKKNIETANTFTTESVIQQDSTLDTNCLQTLKAAPRLPRSNEIGFLRLPQVLELFPVSKALWWRGVQLGKYPKGIKLSARCTAWRRSDIMDLLRELGGAVPVAVCEEDR